MEKRFNPISSKMRSILLCLFVLVATQNSKAATIYFNDIFQGTGSSYTTSTNSLSSIIAITGTGFSFTSANPGDSIFIAVGNDIAGTLQYINASGVLVSLTGTISRQDKVSGVTKGLYFVVTPTPNNAYLLVIPGYTGYSAGDNVSTSSDGMAAAMNTVLSDQQAGAPLIAVSSPTVYEDEGYITYVVSLNKTAAYSISFTPTLQAVTATTPADYTNSMEYSTNGGSTWTAVSGAVSIAAGSTTLQVRVPVVSDNVPEATETFNLVTGTTSGGSVLNSDGTYGIGTILERISVVVTSGSLASFSTCAGTASDAQSFTVSGSGLSNNIVITVPSGYEVSTTSGSGYASSVTLTQSSGNVSSTTIYVRLSSSSTGSPSGNITCVSTGATTQNIAATGSVSSNPSTSDAGIDKTIDNSQTVPMTANTPSTGTGAWTITSGPSTSTGQLSSLSSATAVFDPAGGAGTYVLRWTISNSPCTASYDEVSVIVTWVLPVVWLNFSATKQNETIILNWATASELNSKDFTIQHSINSTTWNDIGEVLAAGNSSIVRNYSFLHTTPSGGNNYYRIRQRDFDGKYSYSTIRMVKKEGNSALGIGVFPNPILNGEMQLYVLQEINALPATVNLLNAKGKIVWSRQYSFGMHKIDVSVIAKGIYLLTGNGRTIRILIE